MDKILIRKLEYVKDMKGQIYFQRRLFNDDHIRLTKDEVCYLINLLRDGIDK